MPVKVVPGMKCRAAGEDKDDLTPDREGRRIGRRDQPLINTKARPIETNTTPERGDGGTAGARFVGPAESLRTLYALLD